MLPLTLMDVGPRDGLQNDEVVLAPAVRAELCAQLAAAGFQRVEAVSFVSDKHVPAMAGAEQVVAALDREATTWIGLVLNERGFDRALACGLERINVTVAVTDSFNRRNQGTDRAGAEALVAALALRAKDAGIPLTATLSVSFGCPFEGRVDPAQTLSLAESVVKVGCDEVVVADTIGVAVPKHVHEVVRGIGELGVRVGGHFHDTRNTGIANALAAYDAGATLLDASVGGVGGCPFAPNATGNVASEDLVYALEESGVDTGIDLDALIDTAGWLGGHLGRTLPGAVSRAGAFPQPQEA